MKNFWTLLFVFAVTLLIPIFWTPMMYGGSYADDPMTSPWILAVTTSGFILALLPDFVRDDAAAPNNLYGVGTLCVGMIAGISEPHDAALGFGLGLAALAMLVIGLVRGWVSGIARPLGSSRTLCISLAFAQIAYVFALAYAPSKAMLAWLIFPMFGLLIIGLVAMVIRNRICPPQTVPS